jgi:hypothetical protein
MQYRSGGRQRLMILAVGVGFLVLGVARALSAVPGGVAAEPATAIVS